EYQCWFGTRNSKVLLRMLCHATEMGNSRWRPPNRVENRSTYISASRSDSDAVPTANPPFSGCSNTTAITQILPPDVTGSRLLKMAAAKPEVLISQLLDQIA